MAKTYNMALNLTLFASIRLLIKKKKSNNVIFHQNQLKKNIYNTWQLSRGVLEPFFFFFNL